MDSNHRTETLLEIEGLEVGYNHKPILPPLDLAVTAGQAWFLVGRNGSGKTTLLRTLLNLLPPVRGTCRWRPGAAVSYVPQRGDYDPTVPSRVIDFVSGGADRRWSFMKPGWRGTSRDRVFKAMDATDVRKLAGQPFAELSEGQKQRALISRALVASPRALVLDEPTSAVDLEAAKGVMELLDRLRREQGIALVLASHQISVVPELATHLILVDQEGGLALAGDVETVTASGEYHDRYDDILAGAHPCGEPDLSGGKERG